MSTKPAVDLLHTNPYLQLLKPSFCAGSLEFLNGVLYQNLHHIMALVGNDSPRLGIAKVLGLKEASSATGRRNQDSYRD